MADIEFERGKELTYPNFYPKLTFTPIFGHRGDFIWVEEVIGAWPEHDSEFTFVRSAVHDQRVDRLRTDNDQLAAENAKLRELVSQMYRDMQGVLDMSTDTVFVDSIGTLRDSMDLHMQAMAELGVPPMDYEQRMRELGVEVER